MCASATPSWLLVIVVSSTSAGACDCPEAEANRVDFGIHAGLESIDRGKDDAFTAHHFWPVEPYTGP
jgi:hypothetical protein